MVDVATLQIEADSRQVRDASVDLDGLSRSSRKAAGEVDNFRGYVDRTSRTLSFFKKIIGTLAVVEVTRQVVQANIEMQRFNNALQVATGSSQGAAREMEFIRDVSKRLGLDLRSTADQYTKLAAASKGTALEGQATRDILIGVAKASTVLGLSAADTGGVLTAMQQIISKNKVSTEELLQIAERVPGTFATVARSLNVTGEQLSEMLRKGELLAEDLLPALSAELTRTFGPQAEKAAQGLNAQINRFNTALFELKLAVGELGLIEAFTAVTQIVTGLANVIATSLIPQLQEINNYLDKWPSTILSAAFGGGVFGFLRDLSVDDAPIVQQAKKIEDLHKKLDSLKGYEIADGGIAINSGQREFKRVNKELSDAISEYTRLAATLEGVKNSTEKLAEGVGVITPRMKPVIDSFESLRGTSAKVVSQADLFTKSIIKQSSEAGKTAAEIRRMEAAHLGVLDAVEPHLRIIEAQAIAEEDLRRSREKQAEELRRIESITQSTRTKQEIFNDTVKELDDLLTKGLGMDAYNRALIKAQEELTRTETKTREFWDTNEQIWIQGVRNIQSSLANGLFDVFDDGLKGMVSGVKRAVGQMLAEFASIKILQSTGIAGLLGLGSTAAFASGGGAGLDALSLASLGNGALNLVQGGFGLTSLAGNAALQLGQITGISSLTNFGAGALNPALASFVTEGAGGFAASAGSAFSSFAGPLALAGIADIGLRSIFGDKKLGGTVGDVLSYVPVVGTLINGLFGRGPLKFREQTLLGDVSGGDFSGALVDRYKASGGLARGSKTDNIIIDADTGALLNQFKDIREGGISSKLNPIADQRSKDAVEIGKLLDQSFGEIDKALRSTAELLGFSTESLDSFNAELKIVSEKGQSITGEQISSEIARITDEMIGGVIPTIGLLSKYGEDASTTLMRLTDQFQVLQKGVQLFGVSADDAASKVRTLSVEEQTALVDRFGGAQNLGAELSQFYDTVLSESQKMDIVEQQILDVLKPLEIDFVPTLKQVYEAVESGNPDLIKAALAVDGLVSQFKEMSDAARDAHIAEMNKIHGERFQLENRLLELQGNTLELRKRELKQIDSSNWALQMRIWMLEDESNEMQALARERRAFTAARREAQSGGLVPTVATTIGGKIFTESEIRAMQQAAVDSATTTLQNIVREQLDRLGESYREAQSFVRDQIDAVREASRFFDGLKADFLEISTSSRAASHEQLNAALALTKSGADISLIDTPELANAIRTLKESRTDLFSTREAFEMDRADAANKVLELSRLGVTHSNETLNTLREQLDVMKNSFEVQEQLLNAQLRFSGVNDASLLSDDALSNGAVGAFNALIERLAIQAGTSFNGSVQFVDPGNQLTDLKNRFTTRFNNTVASTGTSLDFSDMAQAIRDLKTELSKVKESSEKTATILNDVTRGGRAMQTQ